MHKAFKSLGISITVIHFDIIFVNSPIYSLFFNLGQGLYIIGGILINGADLNCAVLLGHLVPSVYVWFRPQLFLYGLLNSSICPINDYFCVHKSGIVIKDNRISDEIFSNIYYDLVVELLLSWLSQGSLM